MLGCLGSVTPRCVREACERPRTNSIPFKLLGCVFSRSCHHSLAHELSDVEGKIGSLAASEHQCAYSTKYDLHQSQIYYRQSSDSPMKLIMHKTLKLANEDGFVVMSFYINCKLQNSGAYF